MYETRVFRGNPPRESSVLVTGLGTPTARMEGFAFHLSSAPEACPPHPHRFGSAPRSLGALGWGGHLTRPHLPSRSS